MLANESELFGNRNRTMVLVALRLLEETYPSELAALLELQLFSVQSILASFERQGLAVSRLAGRTRLVKLNPRYFAAKDLKTLLWTLGKEDVPLQKLLAAKRRRPRQPGKPGLL